MAKFGSVAWQEDRIKEITRKMLRGEKLTSEEKIFAEVQFEHNYRQGIISKVQYARGMKSLKQVM
jgi:hypothetical protein